MLEKKFIKILCSKLTTEGILIGKLVVVDLDKVVGEVGCGEMLMGKVAIKHCDIKIMMINEDSLKYSIVKQKIVIQDHCF